MRTISFAALLVCVGLGVSGPRTPQSGVPVRPDGHAPVRLAAAGSLPLGYRKPDRVQTDKSGKYLVLTHDGKRTAVARLSPHFDPKVRMFGVPIATRAAASSVDYGTKAMESLKRPYRNNVEGSCVIAACLHSVGVHTANETGTPAVYSEAEAARYYKERCKDVICGGGDCGCVPTWVLDLHKSSGFASASSPGKHQIEDYCAVTWTSVEETKAAVALFGGVHVCVALPNSWYSNARNGAVWDVSNPNDPVVGGHQMYAYGYDPQYVYCSTWALGVKMTWAAWVQQFQDAKGNRRNIVECYATLAPDWWGSDQMSPAGVDAAGLRKSLQVLKDGGIPDVPPAVVIYPGEAITDNDKVWWTNSAGTVIERQPYPGFGGGINLAAAVWTDPQGRTVGFVCTGAGFGGGPHGIGYEWETGNVTYSKGVFPNTYLGGVYPSIKPNGGQVSYSGYGRQIVEFDPATGRELGRRDEGPVGAATLKRVLVR